jgi:hypothetical protein
MKLKQEGLARFRLSPVGRHELLYQYEQRSRTARERKAQSDFDGSGVSLEVDIVRRNGSATAHQ